MALHKPSLSRLFLLFAIALLVFLIDFFSKSYVQQTIPLMSESLPIYPYGGIGLFHNFFGISFSINHLVNQGAAWGIFASWKEYLLYFRVFVIGSLLCYIALVPLSSRAQYHLTLIIAGAIGNISDFFLYGHVVDMFHLTFGSYSYPVFNVADSAIFLGVCGLFFDSIVTKKRKK